MKKNKLLLLITCISFLSLGCASTIGRHMNGSGELSVNVTMGLTYTDQIKGIDFMPIPGSISLGVNYGLSDTVNLGMNMYPMAFATGMLVLEPYSSFKIIDQNGSIPRINGYVNAPMQFEFSSGQFNLYPGLGVVPKYTFENKISALTVLEINTDIDEWFSNGANFSLSWTGGAEFQLQNDLFLTSEFGLLNIGRKTIASPLSRAAVGVPLLIFSCSYDVLK